MMIIAWHQPDDVDKMLNINIWPVQTNVSLQVIRAVGFYRMIFISASGEHCFSMYYHMFGSSMGSLLIEVVDAVSTRPVFEKTGDQGQQWHLVQLLIQKQSVFKLKITATRGQSYRSDIAIDELIIRPGRDCGECK